MTTSPPSVLGLAREVLIHGPINRGDLGRRLNLSPATLTRLSKPLLEDGFLIETDDRADAAIGRPVRPLDVRLDTQWYAGIKLTGDFAVAVATDLRSRVLARTVVGLTGHEPSRVVEAIEQAVAELTTALSASGAARPSTPSSIGISIGGKVTESRVAARAPFLDWRDVDLGGLVEARLGLPTVVENDVVALTEAEHWFGLARGIDDFAVVTIGAGVGYGLVLHGRQVITPDTGLGLGGHFPLAEQGPVCMEGHRGCSTAMLSIPSVTSQASTRLARTVSWSDLLALAGAGDPIAVDIASTCGTALGRLTAAVANLAMIRTVVLAGEGIGLVNIPVVQAALRTALAADRDPEASELDLRAAPPDFDEWARGAAAVAIQARIGSLWG